MRTRGIRLAIAAIMLGAPPWTQAQTPVVPAMATVPAGEFEMGSDRGASWERPVHRVRTPGFEIAARPVTNAEFALFRPGHSSPGSTEPSAPVTGVSWQDAADYCTWLGRRIGLQLQLPREAWWERAARGGLSGSAYPWGDQPLAEGAVTPKNDFGVYAVGFNLWEWTADWYSPNYFAVSPALDPHGPERGVYRVLRGGGYRNDSASATVYNRGSARPDTRSASITFRVARALDAEAPPPSVSSAAPAPPKPKTSAPAPAKPSSSAPAPPAAPSQRPAPMPAPAPMPGPESIAPLAPGSLPVTSVSFEEAGGDLIVKLATASQAQFKKMVLGGPNHRVIVDIPGGDLMNNRKGGQVRVGRNGVSRIRYSQFQLDPPAVRVVIDLDGPMDSSVEATGGEVRVLLRPKG
jgi:sulfatase modifying factor 1